MSHLIYMATSKSSGGSYVGLTGRGLDVRRAQHVADALRSARRGMAHGCPAFHAAIIKHGQDDFDWSIVIDGLEEDEAKHMECFLINIMKPRYNVSAAWFNAKAGRRVIDLIGNRVFTSIDSAATVLGVSRQSIMRICKNGRYPTDKIRVSFEGVDELPEREPLDVRVPASARPHRWSEADRALLSSIARAKGRGFTRAMVEAGADAVRRPVRCIQTGTVFMGAKEAAMAHGLSKSAVHTLVYSGGVSYKAGVSFEYMPRGTESWA